MVRRLGSFHTDRIDRVDRKASSDEFERRRGRGSMKARGDGRRETPGRKVLKKRRPPRQRGRMGTSVKTLERASASTARSTARALLSLTLHLTTTDLIRSEGIFAFRS